MAKDYSNQVRKLRALLHLTQHSLAERLNVWPQVVASWEQGRREPSASSYQQLAKLAPPQEAWFFLEKLGVTRELVRSKWQEQALGVFPLRPEAGAMMQIPILRDEAAGWHPDEVRTHQIQDFLAMPSLSAPHGPGIYTGIRIHGDAMQPTLRDGFVAVIDHSRRDPASLSGRIVAARLEETVVVRRLASESGSGYLVLRADNPEHGDISIPASPSGPIIGDIVFWWGTQG